MTSQLPLHLVVTVTVIFKDSRKRLRAIRGVGEKEKENEFGNKSVSEKNMKG